MNARTAAPLALLTLLAGCPSDKEDGATVTVNGSSHASYYPGSETITLKLLWSPDDGRVLGAQAHGKDGVDKRLDIIATAIRGQLKIDDLAHLELAYALPKGGA